MEIVVLVIFFVLVVAPAECGHPSARVRAAGPNRRSRRIATAFSPDLHTKIRGTYSQTVEPFNSQPKAPTPETS
jgi:hypothetical protein